MPITYTDGRADVSGRIGAEECQDFMTWLQSHPDGQVSLADCEHLHAAGLQCLMALKPRIVAPSSGDAWLNAVIKTLQQPAEPAVIAQET